MSPGPSGGERPAPEGDRPSAALQVPRMQPSGLVDCARGLLGLVEISAHDVVPSETELSLGAPRDYPAGVHVHDLGFLVREVDADCAYAAFDLVARPGHVGHGRRFRLSVPDENVPTPQVVHHRANQLRRAGGTRHDAGPQGRGVTGTLVHRLEQVDEHRGNAVDRGAPLRFEGIEGRSRVEVLRRKHEGGAVAHRRQRPRPKACSCSARPTPWGAS